MLLRQLIIRVGTITVQVGRPNCLGHADAGGAALDLSAAALRDVESESGLPSGPQLEAALRALLGGESCSAPGGSGGCAQVLLLRHLGLSGLQVGSAHRSYNWHAAPGRPPRLQYAWCLRAASARQQARYESYSSVPSRLLKRECRASHVRSRIFSPTARAKSQPGPLPALCCLQVGGDVFTYLLGAPERLGDYLRLTSLQLSACSLTDSRSLSVHAVQLRLHCNFACSRLCGASLHCQTPACMPPPWALPAVDDFKAFCSQMSYPLYKRLERLDLSHNPLGRRPGSNGWHGAENVASMGPVWNEAPLRFVDLSFTGECAPVLGTLCLLCAATDRHHPPVLLCPWYTLPAEQAHTDIPSSPSLLSTAELSSAALSYQLHRLWDCKPFGESPGTLACLEVLKVGPPGDMPELDDTAGERLLACAGHSTYATGSAEHAACAYRQMHKHGRPALLHMQHAKHTVPYVLWCQSLPWPRLSRGALGGRAHPAV